MNEKVERGDRVELVVTTDRSTLLSPGDKGTVRYVDSVGTVHVKWDSGSTLGLLPDEDEWKKIDSEKEN